MCKLPPDPIGASSPSPDWQSIRSPNFIYYFRDPSIQQAVEGLSGQDEEFLGFLSRTFQVTAPISPIQTYIFTDWKSALQENLRLPETAIWNVYEQGVFERTNAQSLLVRQLVADSASVVHSGVMTSLQYQFRGQDPHAPALLYRALGELQPPEKMMFQPYSQHALVTYASFPDIPGKPVRCRQAERIDVQRAVRSLLRSGSDGGIRKNMVDSSMRCSGFMAESWKICPRIGSRFWHRCNLRATLIPKCITIFRNI